MQPQLKILLAKAKLNLLVLGGIFVLIIVGKLSDPDMTNRVLIIADGLVGNLILVFVAITMGAFVPQLRLVVLGAIAIFIVANLLIYLGVFTYLSSETLLAVLLVFLGFAAIANLYKHYRVLKF
ncbi:hypothetical protein SAMN06295945_1494 [Polynucleobacter meluiroseus]|uniref:Uncharacterized protein n=1 Tax=Polynucleobacter meluiroseus TaxID=1938814 RepID=A0A240E108_9BURK|nr:hypothetical protein [Polynucleobacter meluiroseus]SNX29129.1 hypothetical protein SAMN06295945_1494 [Polynucleobacter meluiroseus]